MKGREEIDEKRIVVIAGRARERDEQRMQLPYDPKNRFDRRYIRNNSSNKIAVTYIICYLPKIGSQ